MRILHRARVLWRLLDRRLPRATPREARLIERFREEMAAVRVNDPTTTTEWSRNLSRFADLVANKDPRRFLRWDVIQNTMFVRYAPYIRRELRALRGRDDWHARWRPALAESETGQPVPYIWWPESSANAVHHAYHIAEFERHAARGVASLEMVIEFGGGYGSCCRLFHRLGFAGLYVIYDLPQFSALQRFYLETEGLPVRRGLEGGHPGVVCISSLEDLARAAERTPQSHSLFFATWSLSETPISLRERVRPVALGCEHVFIAFQHRFGDLDNEGDFSAWKVQPHFEWISWEIPHLRGNSYLLGRKR